MHNYSDSMEVDSCSPNTEDTERYREPGNPLSKSQVSVRDPDFLKDAWGYRNDSSVKRTCCSHKHPYGGTHLSITPVLGDLMPSPGLHQNQAQRVHAYMQVSTLTRK